MCKKLGKCRFSMGPHVQKRWRTWQVLENIIENCCERVDQLQDADNHETTRLMRHFRDNNH